MKQVAGCTLAQRPRILANEATGNFVVIGKLLPLKQQCELRFSVGEAAVEISRDLIMKAAQKIMAEEMAISEI